MILQPSGEKYRNHHTVRHSVEAEVIIRSATTYLKSTVIAFSRLNPNYYLSNYVF